jgi:Spy/CpxP family protein refolding chaperone
MNFFNKNRLIFWVLTILVVVNISALVTYFLYPKSPPSPACCTPEEQQCNAFRDELDLSDAQTLQVTAINKTYTESAKPIAAAIKTAREDILNELEKQIPDSARLNTLTYQLSNLQMKIQQENIRQYIALKRVCTTGQAHALSALYRDLYGCPMQNGTVKHRNRSGHSNSKKPNCN